MRGAARVGNTQYLENGKENASETRCPVAVEAVGLPLGALNLVALKGAHAGPHLQPR